MVNAFLILEDGTVFKGTSMGAKKEVISEVVFNTSMTGYLEVLTDPSYAGQMLVMTYPLIGNYGVTPDQESGHIWADGLIVRELEDTPSNFRCRGNLEALLVKEDIAGIAGVDTRALAKLLRKKGTMNGMITTNADYNLYDVIMKLHAYKVGDVVRETSCKEPSVLHGEGPRIALLDLGAKASIAASLTKRGCEVTVYPAHTSAETILREQPEGIMLSNGPGDPASCTEIISQVRKLYDSDVPIFAICLGHQLMALANGAKTYKLTYGHRGGNHPVKDLSSGKVYISSQNHGYAVDAGSMERGKAEELFVNVNDGTNEGFLYKDKKIMTVQFHPEASPGPQDTAWLFDKFIEMVKEDTYAEK